MLTLTILRNSREERHQFGNREKVQRVFWEFGGWTVAKWASESRAKNVNPGDWVGIGYADEMEWCRVVGKWEVNGDAVL